MTMGCGASKSTRVHPAVIGHNSPPSHIQTRNKPPARTNSNIIIVKSLSTEFAETDPPTTSVLQNQGTVTPDPQSEAHGVSKDTTGTECNAANDNKQQEEEGISVDDKVLTVKEDVSLKDSVSGSVEVNDNVGSSDTGKNAAAMEIADKGGNSCGATEQQSTSATAEVADESIEEIVLGEPDPRPTSRKITKQEESVQEQTDGDNVTSTNEEPGSKEDDDSEETPAQTPSNEVQEMNSIVVPYNSNDIEPLTLLKAIPTLDNGLTASKSEPRLPVLPPINTSSRKGSGKLSSAGGRTSSTSQLKSQSVSNVEIKVTKDLGNSKSISNSKKNLSAGSLGRTSRGSKPKSRDSLRPGNSNIGSSKKLSVSKESLKVASQVYSIQSSSGSSKSRESLAKKNDSGQQRSLSARSRGKKSTDSLVKSSSKDIERDSLKNDKREVTDQTLLTDENSSQIKEIGDDKHAEKMKSGTTAVEVDKTTGQSEQNIVDAVEKD